MPNWLERPQLFEFDAANTFPSGHMTVFAVFCAGVIWAAPQAARGAAMLLSAGLLAVVSWQLLEYGWHRPSDLIGAQALAIVVFALAAWIGPRGSKENKRTFRRFMSVLNKIAGITLTIAGFVLIAGGLVLIAAASSLPSNELMLNAGEIMLVGVSMLSARILAKLCR